MSVRQRERISKGPTMATDTDRRSHRRVSLRLPVATLGEPGNGGSERRFFTTNVSPGGMLVRMPAEVAPEPGRSLHFEMTVPPGEGYSASPCRVSGRGKVVRTEPLQPGQCGVAVRFTDRLSLGM